MDPERDIGQLPKKFKNPIIINNSLNPLNGKHVKKIWVYKNTKMNREKRDLNWEFYSDRLKNNVTNTLLEAYYKNTKKVSIIYFNDPVEECFEITDEMASILKTVKRNSKLNK